MLVSGAHGLGLESPSKTRQGTQFGPGATSGKGPFPLCHYLVGGLNADEQPAGFLRLVQLERWQPSLQGASPTPEAHLAAPTAEPSGGPSEGRRPLGEHYSLVCLGGALKRETKAKEFEQYSRDTAKQTKTSLNFWKGFIRPTDVILMQIPRPLKILEW